MPSDQQRNYVGEVGVGGWVKQNSQNTSPIITSSNLEIFEKEAAPCVTCLGLPFVNIYRKFQI